MELKILPLTLAKIAQLRSLESVHTRSEYYSLRVAGSVPVRGKFFPEFILL